MIYNIPVLLILLNVVKTPEVTHFRQTKQGTN
jgi:hypothetical protein